MFPKLTAERVGVACLTIFSLSGPALAHDVYHGYGWQNGWGQGHMMGPGYMMGPGFGNQGNPGSGMMPPLQEDLGAKDVRRMMEYRLRWMNNPTIKLGDVEETDADTITADIVTKDGWLVQRMKVDRHTGWIQPGQ